MVVGSEATGSIGGVFVSSVLLFCVVAGAAADGRCPDGGFCRGAVTEEVRAPGRESFNADGIIDDTWCRVAAQVDRTVTCAAFRRRRAPPHHLGQEAQVSTM